MHITNIHRHRITTNNLYILYVLYQLEELTTSIVNIGNSQLCVTIYKCLHPSSSFSIPEKKEELCSWYDVRNITGLIRFQLIKTKFGVICMNVCQSKLIGPSLFFPHVGKGREDSIGISIWSGVVNVLGFFYFRFIYDFVWTSLESVCWSIHVCHLVTTSCHVLWTITWSNHKHQLWFLYGQYHFKSIIYMTKLYFKNNRLQLSCIFWE